MSHALEAPRRLPLSAYAPAAFPGAAFAPDGAAGIDAPAAGAPPRRSPRLGLAVLLGVGGAAWSLIAWAAASVL